MAPRSGADDIRERRFKKAMAMKESIGLTAYERRELAQMLPSVPSDFEGSWKELDQDQLHELITMMEGYIWITYMLTQRR